MLSYAYCGHLLLVTDYMKKKRHFPTNVLLELKRGTNAFGLSIKDIF